MKLTASVARLRERPRKTPREVVLILAALTLSAAADESCIDLTQHDVESLKTYEFQAGAETEAMAQLPVGQQMTVGAMRIVTQPIFDQYVRRMARAYHRIYVGFTYNLHHFDYLKH